MLSHRLDTALTAGDLLASNVNASLKKAGCDGLPHRYARNQYHENFPSLSP